MDTSKRLLFFLFLIFSLTSYAANLATGQWKAHMSYVNGQRIATSENKVYVVASGSLFSFNPNDNSSETYSKVTGLSDVYINDIDYCSKTKTLVICYENGNIDLMSSDGVINIPDLEQKPIYGSKAINKVDVEDGTAYISTAFGILNLNIERAEIKETYILSNGATNSVNGVAIYDNDIYAATDNGLYKADLDNTNLQNFDAWTHVTEQGDPNSSVNAVITFVDHIIIAQTVSTGNSIKAWSKTSAWRQINSVGAFQALDANETRLLISNTTQIRVIDETLSSISIISNYNFSELEFPNQNTLSAQNAIPIDNNTFWVADEHSTLVKYSTSATSTNVSPKGPATNIVWDIDINSDIVRTVHGALTTEMAFTRTPGAISTYENNRWTYIDTKSNPQLPIDLVSIVSNPNNQDHYFVSSWMRGVIEMNKTELITHYQSGNSSLEDIIVWSGNVIVPKIKIDENNRLWATNNLSNSRFHVMDDINSDSRKWTAINPTAVGSDESLLDFVITKDGHKWGAIFYNGNGIVVLDDNNTFDDMSDDRSSHFVVKVDEDGGTKDFSTNVFCLEIDNNDWIWVGTDKGIVYYDNPSDVFSESTPPTANRVKIPRNDGTGLVDYLLDGVKILSLAVDGGNRKWITTATSGVFLVSSDGEDIIHHFTTDNSQLPSDYVRNVTINHNTGEVYFATDAGLYSFRADATSGEETYSNIKVFPNPVRDDYTGDLTITGLIAETTVKITDVSGNLVNQVTSNGGTATWNCKNFNGKRVGTGVYLIFCSDNEGIESGMTKVMVVN